MGYRQLGQRELGTSSRQTHEHLLMIRSIFVAVIICVIILFTACAEASDATPIPTPTPLPPLPRNCEELTPEIVRLSKNQVEAGYGANIAILKIYDVYETRRVGTEIYCRGQALLTSGDYQRLEFHLIKDEDGEMFIGYRGMGVPRRRR